MKLKYFLLALPFVALAVFVSFCSKEKAQTTIAQNQNAQTTTDERGGPPANCLVELYTLGGVATICGVNEGVGQCTLCGYPQGSSNAGNGPANGSYQAVFSTTPVAFTPALVTGQVCVSNTTNAPIVVRVRVAGVDVYQFQLAANGGNRPGEFQQCGILF